MLNYNLFLLNMYTRKFRPGGRVVMQRTANPWMPVRFRPRPPQKTPRAGDFFYVLNVDKL